MRWMLSTLTICAALAAGLVAPTAMAATIYVDASASGANDGSTWADAYSRLQSALAAAASGDEIWVAQGTYYTQYVISALFVDKQSAFELVEGVDLYGGFDGTEAMRSQRDPKANPTVLSGRIVLAGLGPPVPLTQSYHVVKADSSITSATLVDGVTIRDGLTEDFDFALPEADYSGAGLYIDGGGPWFNDCIITSNAADEGGGAYVINSADPLFIRCEFTDNEATFAGGGLELDGAGASFINCLLARNHAGSRGGAVYAISTLTLTMTNCTVAGNTTDVTISDYGAGLWRQGAGPTFELYNTIVWGNVTGMGINSEDSNISTVSAFSHVVDHCCIAGWTGAIAAPGTIDANPAFIADYSNLRLLADSPCVEAGDFSLVSALGNLDRDGNPRNQDFDCGIDFDAGEVDMGAYELDESTQSVIFVDANGAPTTPVVGSGRCWADAYTELKDAFDDAAASGGVIREIWVADGSYLPTGSLTPAPDATFQLLSGLMVLGGFDGGETDRNDRDPSVNVCILTAFSSFFPLSDRSDHVVTASGVDTTAILDGFRITGGQADNAGLSSRGAGLYNDGGSPMIIGCTFIENAADDQGGAIYNANGAAPHFINCSIIGNSSGGVGGGVLNDLASPTFVNCAFFGNTSDPGGGSAMYNDNSTSTLINCTIVGNVRTGGNAAAGVFDFGGTTTIRNCILWNNQADGAATQAAQLFTSTGAFDIEHSIVQGWTGSLGGAGNLGANPGLLDPAGPDDTYGTLDDDPRLGKNARGIDAGNASALPADAGDVDRDGDSDETIGMDLHGHPRLRDDPGVADTGATGPPVVDLGAVEFQLVSCRADIAPMPPDGAINVTDLLALLAAWGACPGGADPCVADINRDGQVNVSDLLELLAAWGPCP